MIQLFSKGDFEITKNRKDKNDSIKNVSQFISYKLRNFLCA